jgi:membrane protease YdiL (CAAX protease family)
MNHFDPIAIWYLAVFGVFLPFVVIRARSRAHGAIGIPPLKKQAIQIVVMELFFLLVALAAARTRQIDLFAQGSLPLKAIILAAVVLVLGVITLPLRWKLLSTEQKLKALATRPQKAGDLPPWFVVSVAAGVVEEIVYRGVMMALVLPMTRNWWLSVAICVLLFALGHLNQPVLMVVILVPMTVALHFLVAWTGSLYLAMTAHFLYDFLAGVVFIRIAREYRAAASSPYAAQPAQESSAVAR